MITTAAMESPLYKINKRPKEDTSDDETDIDMKSVIKSFIRGIGKALSFGDQTSDTESDDESDDPKTPKDEKENKEDYDEKKDDSKSINQAIDEFTKVLNVLTRSSKLNSAIISTLNEYYTMEFTNDSELVLFISYVDYGSAQRIKCNLIGAVLLVMYHHTCLNDQGFPIAFDESDTFMAWIKKAKDDEEGLEIYTQRKQECMKCLDLLDLLLECGVNPSVEPLPIAGEYEDEYHPRFLKLISIYDEWEKDDTKTEPYQMEISDGEYCYGFRTIYHLSSSMKRMFSTKLI